MENKKTFASKELWDCSGVNFINNAFMRKNALFHQPFLGITYTSWQAKFVTFFTQLLRQESISLTFYWHKSCQWINAELIGVQWRAYSIEVERIF